MRTIFSKSINPEKFKGKCFESMHEVVQIGERSAKYFNKEKKDEECRCSSRNQEIKCSKFWEIA